VHAFAVLLCALIYSHITIKFRGMTQVSQHLER